MNRFGQSLMLSSVILLTFGFLSPNSTEAQFRIDEVVGKSEPGLNRARGQRILKQVKDTLERHYYDKNFRGIEIDKRFKEASERIKTLDTNTDIYRVIAEILIEFNDSHTRFYPPGRSDRVEYGFSMQMIGENCYVVDVKSKSDAAAKGLKIGDRIARVGQYPVTRNSLWVINYIVYYLEPIPALPITILEADGSEKKLLVAATFKSLEERLAERKKRRKDKAEDPYKCHVLGNGVVTCKLKSFAVERKFIDQMMREVAKGTKLILDLRGNRGGYVRTNEYLTGHFFEREVKMVDMITRRKTETRIAKPTKNNRFAGELIVLIDSDSASASEVFARIVQLEKRGRVIGDVSAGAVMTSFNMGLSTVRGGPGFETITPFGMNVTIGDVIMSDGNRIEGMGVLPDVAVGPTSNALKSGTDPVLSYAASLLGVEITEIYAGNLGFLLKKAEDDEEEEQDDEAL